MRRTCLAAETADFLRGYEAGASDSEAGRHAKRPPHPDDVPALPQDIFNLEKRGRRNRQMMSKRWESPMQDRVAELEAEVEKLQEEMRVESDISDKHMARAALTAYLEEKT